MSLSLQLLRTFVIWGVVLIVIVCIILLPRTVEYDMTFNPNTQAQEVTFNYVFSWSSYVNDLHFFFWSAWENKSLGLTKYGNTAEYELVKYMKRSLPLIAIAFVISFVFGILKGIYDYQSKVSKIRAWFAHGSTWLFQSIPDFFVIILFQWIVILLMRQGFPDIPIYGHDNWYNVITPSLLLSIYPMMYIASITASTLEEEDRYQYVQAARSKGLLLKVVIYRHMLKNACIKIATHSTSVMLYILSNLLMIEYLMFYQGAAYRFMHALGYSLMDITTSPYRNVSIFIEEPMVVALSLAFLILIFSAKCISIIAQRFLDPRLRGE